MNREYVRFKNFLENKLKSLRDLSRQFSKTVLGRMIDLRNMCENKLKQEQGIC